MRQGTLDGGTEQLEAKIDFGLGHGQLRLVGAVALVVLVGALLHRVDLTAPALVFAGPLPDAPIDSAAAVATASPVHPISDNAVDVVGDLDAETLFAQQLGDQFAQLAASS